MALASTSIINVSLQASVAVKLCCRASWTCVSHLCESFANKSSRLCSDVSEDAITNIVGEACAKSAFLLDLLYQGNIHNKLSKTMGYSLEKWSAAENVFNRLPSPAALVKQWVKVDIWKLLAVFSIICIPALIFACFSDRM